VRAFTCPQAMRWLARHTRATPQCVALLAFVALAAAGCDDNGASSPRSAGTQPSGTVSPSARQRVWSLLAPPDVSFQVIFTERTPSREGKYFVWTQGGGMRRWDEVLAHSGKATSGEISIDTSFSSLGLGDAGMTCGWNADPDLAPGLVDLHCHEGSDWSLAAFAPVADALRSYVADRLPDQTIADRTASCYSFNDFRYSVAGLCLDSQAGMPLALWTVSRGDTLFTRELEAISVSAAEQRIAIPDIEFVEDSPYGLGPPHGEAVVPFSTLQLPDFSQFQE